MVGASAAGDAGPGVAERQSTGVPAEARRMKILDRYLAGVVMLGTGIALLVILGLDLFFTIISQLDDVGEGSYTLAKVLLYSLLTLPRSVYELFPTAALLGGLIGLGTLAVHSELAAMRAVGFPVWRIVRAVLQAGLIMLVFIVALGEFAAPVAEQYGQQLRAVALEKRISFMGRDGLWVREDSRYIFAKRIIDDNRLADLDVYDFDANRQLLKATHAGSADYRDGEWVLHDLQQSVFAGDGVTTRQEESVTWPSLLTPELISIVMLKPENMSAQDIRQFIVYLDDNGLDTRQYRYALWGRFVTPLSALVMLFIAVPFVFGSLRSVGAGQRIFVGTLAGFGFYMTSQMAGQMGQVYGLNPMIGNLTPSLVVLGLGIFAIRRI
jgi:lipopolysaccharide export system permease protein